MSKSYVVKYRGLGRDMHGDDPLCEMRVETSSAILASAEVRKARSDVHYIVSVTEA